MLGIIVGAVLGFLSGLGVGGGSLLLLWLTAAAGFPQDQARLMNLMFFLPCALAASLLRRTSAPDQRLTRKAAAGGVLGALLGTMLGGLLPTGLLRRGLGILFLITGVRELWFRDKK